MEVQGHARSLSPPWETKVLLNLSEDTSTWKKTRAEESFPLDGSHSISHPFQNSNSSACHLNLEGFE